MVKVTVPDEIVEAAGSIEAVAEQMKQLLVLDLIRRQHITRNRAAELLGMHLLDLAQLMEQHGLYYYGEVDPDDARAEEQTLAHLRTILPSQPR